MYFLSSGICYSVMPDSRVGNSVIPRPCSLFVFRAELGDAIASLHPDPAPEFTRGNAQLLSAFMVCQKLHGDRLPVFVERV
jgi:hypothetical protein